MLGRHSSRRQKRTAYIVIGALAVLGVVLGTVLSGTSQNAARGPQIAAGGPQSPAPSVGATTTTTTTLTTSKTAGGGLNPAYLSTGAVGASTPQTPTTVDIPTTTTTTSTTSGTTTTVPPGATIAYSATVDPRFAQDPANPLKVTYTYSAQASTTVNGVDLALASLPAGTLSLSANGAQECTMQVGGTVSGGTCPVTFAAFGSEAIVATYATGGASYGSTTATDNVGPYGTTTMGSIHGGGSLGGLVFDTAVVDSNGNAVTVGAVNMVIADVTQGWSYNVNGVVGGDGANPKAFSCILVENYPTVGEYSGCGFGGQIVRTPASGDELTVVATYGGVTDWLGSAGGLVTYSMP